MTRMARNDTTAEQDETTRKAKRYRLDLGFKELVFYGFGLLLALTWMFVFGILVGRGIPLVSSDELSVQAHLLRFLGLGPQIAKQEEPETAEKFDSPRTMLETLEYCVTLTRKNDNGPPPLRSVANVPSQTAAQKQTPSTQPPRTQTDTTATAPQPPSAVDVNPPEHFSEHFSLLVSSMKEAENAQRLLDQLRGKGYTPRIETVSLSGSGRWNRVLVGFFASREEAMRFAAEFNRKERMEALVVRETR